MSAGTASFLSFSTFNLLCLCLGYASRRRGWLDEEWSRPIHLHTVVWIWSAASLLSLWRIPIRVENLWLVVVQPVLMCLCAYGSIPLSRAIGCSRAQTGVIAVAAGLGNHGFTLGSYLCYVLLTPSTEALAYSTAYAMVTNISVLVLIYPLARRFGPNTPGVKRESIGVMMVKNFVDLRAMPMYGALAGLCLAGAEVPFPGLIDRWHVLDVLFYVGGFGGYFGIGLRLRLGDSRRYFKHHVLLAALKLAVMPLAGVGLLWLINQTPRPMGPLVQDVVRVQTMTPCAIITVMIANVFHLDPRMASVAWVWNTVLFAGVSLPIVLFVIT